MPHRGWTASEELPTDPQSPFLGSFHRPLDADFIATVEFSVQTTTAGMLVGPTFVERPLLGVDAEIGVRHLPAERLLKLLDTRCEADIVSELGDLLDPQGDTTQHMTDLSEVDAAVSALVALIDTFALRFASAHATVDAVLAFIAKGRVPRTEEYEVTFVPTLLAAGGRSADARDALERYRASGSRATNTTQYEEFAERLTAYLAGDLHT